jgi:hypothetical protein
MYIQMNMKFHKLIKKEKEKVKCVCSWLSIQRCDATNFPREWKLYSCEKKMKSCEKNGPMVKFWAL